MSQILGDKLKSLRESVSLTAKEVSERLKEFDYEISDKTIYGYESSARMPNADVFLALCEIYNCKNILETFRDVKANYSIPDDKEWEMIEKYRSLDDYGADLVDTVLEKEYERCNDIKENGTLQFTVKQETGKIAARNGRELSSDEKNRLLQILNSGA